MSNSFYIFGSVDKSNVGYSVQHHNNMDKLRRRLKPGDIYEELSQLQHHRHEDMCQCQTFHGNNPNYSVNKETTQVLK